MRNPKTRITNIAPTPYAVLDVETTGFAKADRIVEISIITIDYETLETIEEYDTLVNPERDIPNDVTRIHKLTPSILEAAPTFEEIAPAVAKRLNSAYLVAHNQHFDMRILEQEFSRIKATFRPGNPVCTLQLSGGLKLKKACHKLGVNLEEAHRALTDARATAGLLRVFLKESRDKVNDLAKKTVARCVVDSSDVVIRTLRRENTVLGSDIKRIARSPWQDPKRDYRYALNLALDNGELSSSEKLELEALRKELGLSEEEAEEQRNLLFDRACAAAERDGQLSDFETQMLTKLASSLDIEYKPNTTSGATFKLRLGMTVCFTGSGQGMLDKISMSKIAESRGLIAKNNVTKSLSLLVAADVTSFSGKAKIARGYDVPVVSAEQFLREIDNFKQ